MSDETSQSFSSTLLAALSRLQEEGYVAESTERTVLVCGADMCREGGTAGQTLALFAPALSRLASSGCKLLRLDVIGPGLWVAAAGGVVRSESVEGGGDACVSVVTRHFGGTYEQFADALARDAAASTDRERAAGVYALFDVAICFDAGVWGYDSWPPSLLAMARVGPVVVTAYNMLEADDDQGALEDYCRATGGDATDSPDPLLAWVWEPELNPHGSRVERDHPEPELRERGVRLADNAAWQCLIATGKRKG